MTDNDMQELHAHHLQMSVDMGVPRHLYENSPDFIDWYGRFVAPINNKEFEMVITTSTLIVDESDPASPVAQLIGSEWLETPIGQIFHADYVTSAINGGFQIFRKRDSAPFEGFESVSHTHLLVYTDGAGQKQFFPVVVDFASD